MKRWISSAAVILFLTTSALAQTLADKVPSDAAMYVGWRGVMEPEAGYAGSRWEAIVQASQFTAFVDQALPAIGKAVGLKNRQQAAVADAAASVVRQIIRHPAALYVAIGADGMPYGGVLCQAQSDEAALRASIEQLVSLLPPDARAAADSNDGIVSLTFNASNPAKAALATQPGFKAAMTQVAAGGSLVVYLNVDAILSAGTAQVKKSDASSLDMVQKFLTSSGLTNVHGVAVSQSFKNRNWQADAFIDAPSPRKGLMALADFKPLDQDLFKRVPASANLATQLPFDAEQLLATIRQIAADTYPPARDYFDKGLNAVTLAVGKNLETELLPSLGKQWAIYTSPQVGGSSFLGGVLVNKLANPTKARQAMGSIAAFLANSGASATQTQPFTLTMRTLRVGDTSVTYAATPGIAPGWAIKDGYFYVGLFPQTIAAAAQYQGDSLADSPAFKEAFKNLDKPEVASVTFQNLAVGFDEGYGGLLVLGRTALGLHDMFLGAAPEPMIPPISVFSTQLAPAASAFWSDAAGIHSRVVEPFPAASTIANLSFPNALITQAPVLSSILLPSLNRSREAANRIKSASNLRQLGLACKLYANEHQGKFPPDWKTVLQTQDVTPDIFITPRTEASVPPIPQGQTAAQALGDWVNTESSYVYLGAGKKDDLPSDFILAYEKPEGLTDGINMLFADGHVDFVSMGAVADAFKLQNQSAPQMP